MGMTLLWPNGSPTIPHVTSEFGPRAPIDTNNDGQPDTNPFHYGIDLVGFPIVKSPVDGVVTLAAMNGGAGNEARIKADNNHVFRLFHNDSLLISKGQHVTAGQDVASMGETGQATGVHCHFQIEVNGKPVDPRVYYAQHQPAGTPGAPTPDLGDPTMPKIISVKGGTIAFVSEFEGRAYTDPDDFSLLANRAAYGEVSGLTPDQVTTLVGEANARGAALVAQIVDALRA